MCNDLTLACLSHPLHRGDIKKKRVILSPGRREEWKEAVFKIWFYFSLPFSDLVGNKLY